ncbi:MAG: molybdopterin-dependent oxidoreductase [Campylobacterales bacterium]|nr:molybdopterin-dependent oxidoreductase [Campylobacterales bacterium]
MGQTTACRHGEGIIAGRDSNDLLSFDTLQEAEVVVVWGVDFDTIHSNWLPCLEDKRIVIIDPFYPSLSEGADLHIKINPHCDLHLALLLSRFTIIEGSHDEEFLQKYANNYEDFYELTQSVRIKSTLEFINVTLGQIGALLELIREKKTIILVGSGVQKSQSAQETLEAIDAFGMILGLFEKAGCGMHFLGQTMEGSKTPFRGHFEFMEEVDLSLEIAS